MHAHHCTMLDIQSLMDTRVSHSGTYRHGQEKSDELWLIVMRL